MIFVDTSFWVALGMRRDGRHEDAARLFRIHESEPLLTTNHVRGECWTFLRRRVGHWAGTMFLDLLDETTRVHVQHVEPELEGEALSWLRRHDEREYSFVDATSFAVMRARGLRSSFAFDGDFAAAGFEELRP